VSECAFLAVGGQHCVLVVCWWMGVERKGWGGGGKCVRESRRVRCSVLRLAHAERGRRGEAETLHCALCARMSEPPAAAVEVEAGHLVFIIYIFESICQ